MDGVVAESERRRSSNGSPSSPSQQRQPAHQRFVFSDPAAFRYLEEDHSTTVLERQRRLKGYELYVVEQWACSRMDPTFVITTYTGLEQHSVLVSVLSVPTNEETWSPRLKTYFQAIAKYHARKKETPLGTLMVTNLSGFPSALNVIVVPDGDLRKHRVDFFVNENLKRLGCAGRAGLDLSPPVQATEAKFARLYRTSDRVPLHSAVIELVKLCQVALMLFGELVPEYADGLLCDMTEKAINEWWTKFGTELFGVDPHDGILGPTTVAALLGTLLGARNRLHAYGAPVGKDVFDLVSTKRGISYFQKSQKLPRNRRLDWKTLDRLHTTTAKAAKSSEGWMMPRAVKSTVAELSGKGHELVASEAREKAGIAEIETLDIETFVQLASGERSKWLWYGKPRKRNNSDVFRHLGSDDGMVLEQDTAGGYVWSKKQRDSIVDEFVRSPLSDRVQTSSTQSSAVDPDFTDKDQALRRTVLKNVTGRMTDARSGFGRIKDAVGIRGHHHRQSKGAASISDVESLRERSRKNDEQPDATESTFSSSRFSHITTAADDPLNGTPPSPRSRRESSIPDERMDPIGTSGHMFTKATPSDKYAPWELAVESDSEDQGSGNVSEAERSMKRAKETERTTSLASNFKNLLQGKDEKKGETEGQSFSKTEGPKPQKSVIPIALQRTNSLPQLPNLGKENSHVYRWPRQLSFSVVVDVVSVTDDSGWKAAGELDARNSADTALSWERARGFDVQTMNDALRVLKDQDGVWVKRKVSDIEDLDGECDRDQENLDAVYSQKLGEYHALQQASDDLLAEEKASLGEATKDLDVLGAKLEYELNALESKVEDVENAVAEFERQVMQAEWRAEELNVEMNARHSWLWWPLQLFASKEAK
ncbi:MAG: hypothetical protein Q9190_002654 [Brigantiaea leucoxantha]